MSEEVLGSRELMGGEEISIRMATPPLSKRLVDFMLKTPELSQTERESRMRLFGGLRGQSSDYFFIGEIKDVVIGSVWYCTPANCKEIAYMGEVFTVKEQRGKGIATNLLNFAIDFFRKNGGKAFYVTNLCPHAPHNIFRKLGFQPYGYGRQAFGGVIRLVVDGKVENFDQDYYLRDPDTSVRNANWGDLPHFIALLNYPHDWIVRAYNFGLIGHACMQILSLKLLLNQKQDLVFKLRAIATQKKKISRRRSKLKSLIPRNMIY
jgi:GNAT superfamily N-acetyltransferase